MSEQNLKDAFAGESQAHMKYLAFADKAEKDNLPNVARLFRANSYAEQIHATNHLRTLSGIDRHRRGVWYASAVWQRLPENRIQSRLFPGNYQQL